MTVSFEGSNRYREILAAGNGNGDFRAEFVKRSNGIPNENETTCCLNRAGFPMNAL